MNPSATTFFNKHLEDLQNEYSTICVIGPRKEVIQHLRKSEGYDIFMEGIHDEEKQEAISHGGVSE